MKYQKSESERVGIGRMRIGSLLAVGAASVMLLAAAVVFPDAVVESNGSENGSQIEGERIEILNPEYTSGYGSSELVGTVSSLSGTSTGTFYSCDSKEELEEIIREMMVSRTSIFSVRYQKASKNDVLNTSSFRELMDAVFADDDTDNPADSDYLRLSWTKGGFKALSYERYVIYDFSFTYLTTLQQEKQLDVDISKIAGALGTGLLTDSQKVKAVKNYLKLIR